MANEEHLELLKLDVIGWNKWRAENSEITPDLSGALLTKTNLSRANLSGANLNRAILSYTFLIEANLRGANLSRVNLSEANISRADLNGANLNGANLVEANFIAANLKGAILNGANLSKADLSRSLLTKADLNDANLSGAKLNDVTLIAANLRRTNLSGVDLSRTDLFKANLIEADLSGGFLFEANLREANLSGAILIEAKLYKANLCEANLSGANLSGADLDQANLNDSDLTKANLTKANLSRVSLVDTKLEDADLSNSRVYGISAWDLVLENTTQTGLIITKKGDPTITVNDIEVAQFIYFMLNNKKIRRVINALTSKAVLILGRFTKKRKEILNALRDKLSGMDYLPIIFDFAKPTDRDFTETVLTLACLSKFVIIDLTDPSSSPHESKTTIPDLEIPFLPIIQEGKREYAMFKNFKKYPWVLEGKTYKNKDDLIQNIEKLTAAAEAKYSEISAQKNNSNSGFTPL